MLLFINNMFYTNYVFVNSYSLRVLARKCGSIHLNFILVCLRVSFDSSLCVDVNVVLFSTHKYVDITCMRLDKQDILVSMVMMA